MLEKSPLEITTKLKEITSSDEDIIFNYEGYPLLCDLERFLRDLIFQRICVKFAKTISNKVHQDYLRTWRERRTKEESYPFMKKGYRLIEYSDFSDLKRIFLKGKNKE